MCVVVITIGTLVHCGGPNPIDYSNAIIDSHNHVMDKLNHLVDGFADQSADEIQERYEELLEQIEISSEVVNSLPDFQGDTVYREKAVKMMEMYNQLARKEIKEMVEIYTSADADMSDEEEKRFKTLEWNMRHLLKYRVSDLDQAREDFGKQFSF